MTNAIFEWLSKPFRGDYKSANKQFIAPLPVPKASRTDRAALSALAKGMQQRRTRRVELRADLDERLESTARTNWPLEKMLPGVRSIPEIEEAVPKSVPPSQRKPWVDEHRKTDEEAALARIDGLIHPASEAAVVLDRGKLAFQIDELEAARVFVSDDEAALVEAQWRSVALDFQPSGKGDAKRLVDRLRRVATVAEFALTEQIIATGETSQANGGASGRRGATPRADMPPLQPHRRGTTAGGAWGELAPRRHSGDPMRLTRSPPLAETI